MNEENQDQDKEISQNLCFCLYDTIINLKDDCLYHESTYAPKVIDYVDKLKRYVEDIEGYDETHDDYDKGDFLLDYHEAFLRLALITNEQMYIDDVLYSRVYRIVHRDHILGANKLRDKYDITIWCTCIDNIKQNKYIIYHKGTLLLTMDCPPELDDIEESIHIPTSKRRHITLSDVIINKY